MVVQGDRLLAVTCHNSTQSARGVSGVTSRNLQFQREMIPRHSKENDSNVLGKATCNSLILELKKGEYLSLNACPLKVLSKVRDSIISRFPFGGGNSRKNMLLSNDVAFP